MLDRLDALLLIVRVVGDVDGHRPVVEFGYHQALLSEGAGVGGVAVVAGQLLPECEPNA